MISLSGSRDEDRHKMLLTDVAAFIAFHRRRTNRMKLLDVAVWHETDMPPQ
jgi:hypothetical protein